jgi:hypothetical protein
MRVDGPRGKLYDSQKVLRARWEDVSTAWTDVMRQEFEERTWTPLDLHTSECLRAIDRLAQIFHQLRDECQGNRY